MPRGYRSEQFALGLGILILLAAWSGLVWQIASQKEFYADTAEQQAERAAAEAEAEMQDCLAYSARIDVLQCIEGVAETKRANQRAEYDLAAQQEMAFWTPWILLSSVLAAVAAYIGVVYLARSNEVVRQSSIEAQRPWVSVNPGIVGPLVLNEDSGRITIRFELKNFGASPAIGVNVDAKIVATPSRVRFVLDEIRVRAQSFPKKAIWDIKYFLMNASCIKNPCL